MSKPAQSLHTPLANVPAAAAVPNALSYQGLQAYAPVLPLGALHAQAQKAIDDDDDDNWDDGVVVHVPQSNALPRLGSTVPTFDASSSLQSVQSTLNALNVVTQASHQLQNVRMRVA